jgi:hypothetical protein
MSMASEFDISFSIGGTTVHLLSEDRRLAPPADGVLQQFVTDDHRADVEIRARWTDEPDASGGEVIFDSGVPWRLARVGANFVFTFRSELGGEIPYKTARFNETFTYGDVQVYRPHFTGRPDEPINPLEYPLDELLMIHQLSQGKGVEIHGCAVLDADDRAYVFAGQSGAGKSTIARLWEQHSRVRLLSDERVVVRTDRDPVMVYGTPWHGDALHASSRSGELAGVFFLEHAPANDVTHMTGAAALAKLFSCSFLPFHGAVPLNHTASALEKIVTHAACHRLRFTPDASAIEMLEQYVSH